MNEERCPNDQPCGRALEFENRMISAYQDKLEEVLTRIIDNKLNTFESNELRLQAIENNLMVARVFNKFVVSITAIVSWVSFIIVMFILL